MKIMLIDDHALFRDGLNLVLSSISEVEQVFEQETGMNAIAFVRASEEAGDDIDLILLDYQLGDMDGLSVLAEIKNCSAAIPIIMLSAHENSELIQTALQAGASGFISKTSTSNVMLSAIKLVLAGGIYIPPQLLEQSISNTLQLSAEMPAKTFSPTAKKPPIAVRPPERKYQLTNRQQDVMTEMGKGLANKEIARELDMSPSTVKVHVAAILKELEVKNRTQAVSIARLSGLID